MISCSHVWLARQIAGLEAPLAAAREAYAASGRPERLEVVLQQGVAHAVSPEMEAAVEAFLRTWLLGSAAN